MATEELNILHIDTEIYWRGGQQQVFYLHKTLVEKGFNSHLVCNKSSELKNKCVNDSLPYFEQKMRGEIDVLAAYKISRFCRKEKIDIIQAHSAHALGIALLTKYFYTSPKLIGVRRVDFPINKNFLSQLKYNSCKIDKIVCISDFIKKVLIADGIKVEKLVTIRSGTDINKYDHIIPESNFKEAIGISSNQFILGTVAAFSGHKDYPNLLNAFSNVRSKITNIKLCLVGDGPLKQNAKDLAKHLEIDKDIIFTGFVNNVGEYLKTFDIFVLASKKEGLGTSLIDALSVGLPIIATNTGGIPELITNEKNGILVEARNHNKLADAIVSLVNDSQKRDKLSVVAKQSSKDFSIEETVKQNIEEYNNLLAEK
jgi:L-malate glycosyltransferase